MWDCAGKGPGGEQPLIGFGVYTGGGFFFTFSLFKAGKEQSASESIHDRESAQPCFWRGGLTLKNDLKFLLLKWRPLLLSHRGDYCKPQSSPELNQRGSDLVKLLKITFSTLCSLPLLYPVLVLCKSGRWLFLLTLNAHPWDLSQPQLEPGS